MKLFDRLALLSCLLASLFPLGARAQCQQWDATGGWKAIQSNITVEGDDTQPVFSLEQTGSELRGSARFHRAARGEGDRDHNASVDGTISNATIELTAYWDDGSIGVYTGAINPIGRAEGDAYDRLNPRNRAHWYSERRFNCMVAAPVPKATVHLGRVSPRTAPTPGMSICDAAKSARARNSPAAPSLERRCVAEGGTPAGAAPGATELKNDHSALAALLGPAPATTSAALAPIDPAQRNTLAANGAQIAQIDPSVAEARAVEANADETYRQGFDIATGLFGDPALGAEGNTVMGPGSAAIRDSLDASGQRGFNDSVAFHLAREYRH